jgi:hypothetical protein
LSGAPNAATAPLRVKREGYGIGWICARDENIDTFS